MKITVTYASAGAGHYRAAQAIYGYFKQCCDGADLKLIDALDKTNAIFEFLYKYGYGFLVKYFVGIWYIAYLITDLGAAQPFIRYVAGTINYLNTNRFRKFLVQENPDFVVSTHFLSSEIAATLKKAKKIKSQVITVVTDFGVHPFWVNCSTDFYIVASSFTKKELLDKGIEEANILEYGIPVSEKFLEQFRKDELCKKFDINKDKFTILIMTGSFGFGPIEEIVNALYQHVQMLVVCARNERLYLRLKERNLPCVRVFGFVDNAQELMAVSDIIVTKPGGLTISELLVMDLAPIFISAIPGQEAINMRALGSYSIGVSPKDISGIKEAVLDFKNEPEKLKELKEKIAKIKKPNALKDLCNLICKNYRKA